MQIWRRRRRTACQEAGERCEFNVVHEMVHNGLDGRVFRVRRLVCGRCGERVTEGKEQNTGFVPPAWRQGEATVEANF